MTRVLEGRVGDRGRKSTLYALANYAGMDGRNSYPSVERLAHDAECSEATVRRDLKALQADGWIRRGDQQHVAHLRADRRPVVYDIAMTEDIRAAWRAEQDGGDGTDPRPVSLTPRDGGPAGNGATTGQDDTPSEGSTGCQNRADGVSKQALRGVTAVTPEPYEPVEPTPPLPPASGGRPDLTIVETPACTKPGVKPHTNCRPCGTTPRQIAAAERRAAADARRAADQAEARRAREAKAAARAAGVSEEARRAIEDIRGTVSAARANLRMVKSKDGAR
jgi:hypothetical protein